MVQLTRARAVSAYHNRAPEQRQLQSSAHLGIGCSAS